MPRSGIMLICIAVLLAGCGQGKHSLGAADLLRLGGAQLGLISSYEMIQHDFEHGRLMEARERVLAMQRTEPDYAKAQALYREKIEPARRRVFLHYLRTARRMESRQLWSKAMWAYDQAAAVSVKPANMIIRRDKMALQLRQLRLNRLIAQRRLMDRQVLDAGDRLNPPAGLDRDDAVYTTLRARYDAMLDDRAKQAMGDAKHYVRQGLPELAYIEIESYLGMQPDEPDARLLRDRIVKTIPKALRMPVNTVSLHAAVSRRHSRRSVDRPVINEEQIQLAIKRDDLVEALALARQYRDEKGASAEGLLKQLEQQAVDKAGRLFAEGSKSFRAEKLNRAITFWQHAVRLNPEEKEYAEALRRARQLQERLTVLRGEPHARQPAPTGKRE